MTRSATLIVALALVACSGPDGEARMPGDAPATSPDAPADPAADASPAAPGEHAAGGDTARADTTAAASDRPPYRGETTTIRLFFTRDDGPQPVDREIPPTRAPLRSALEHLLQGPTPAERAAGFSSWFSHDTAGMLRGVRLDAAGKAVVDFHDLSRVIGNASTSAGSRILLGELNHTVFQFATVRSVEYRMDGSCDAFWNWIQTACTVVDRRDMASSGR